jgi:DNA-binding NarL/FixJ family response regulator
MLTDNPIRVIVIDDHPVVREGVISQLRLNRDIFVIGGAATGVAGIALCAREQPDIVLLDLRLPDYTAADVVLGIHLESPKTRVLLFTAFPEHISVAATLAAGAVGLLVKDANGPALRDALREVMKNGHFRSAKAVAGGGVSAPVTPREYDVLRLVASGHTNIEIGIDLGLSHNTVKAYLHNVMIKLGSRNRAQLISEARSHGLL